MGKIKLLAIALCIGLIGLTLNPIPGYASSPKSSLKCGVNTAAGKACEASSTPGADIESLIARIINVLSILIGAIAIIMIIYAGFRYVTSAGNESALQSAKNTILYAIIGLIIVALAQVIVKFVLRSTSAPPEATNTVKTLVINHQTRMVI